MISDNVIFFLIGAVHIYEVLYLKLIVILIIIRLMIINVLKF